MYDNRGGGGALGALVAFVLGGLFGAIMGILFAPQAGKETRDQIKERADEFYGQGRDFYETQRERVLEAVEGGKRVVAERSDEVRARIDEARGKLKEGVDAAADFAEEKIAALKDDIETPDEPAAEAKS